MKSSSYSGAARPRKRTGADHFGLFTLFLLLAASLALYIRLMATGMLSNLYLIILMMVLIVLNAVSVIVQLPLRRNKAGKLIMGIVSLLLSGAMLYGRGCRELRPVRAEQDRRQDDGDGDHRGARHERQPRHQHGRHEGLYLRLHCRRRYEEHAEHPRRDQQELRHDQVQGLRFDDRAGRRAL